MASQAKVSRIALNQILFATDFSRASENALHCATALARRFHATLTVAHAVVNRFPTEATDTYPKSGEVLWQNAKDNMAALETSDELRSLLHRTVMEEGDTGDVILGAVIDKNIDLLVMGTHGYGGTDMLLLGSTAEKVMRRATCPVLTLGPHVHWAYSDGFKHIVYVTDFSSGSKRALTYALALAEEDRARLTLAHIIQSKPVSEAEMSKWRQQDGERLSRMLPDDTDLAHKPEVEVSLGLPHEEILRMGAVRNADLIVMGSHTGGPVSTHVPWTTLHHVLCNAHCPVLTVHGE